jgi:hypothetical protein
MVPDSYGAGSSMLTDMSYRVREQPYGAEGGTGNRE